ncbi:unnamed protein product [Rotaria sordida]|uniref:NAD(P)(+)--arginine ADP-ribosyltransferase n=1 Tax=Rotaria sordida TaxID=392033 RepID=A0A818UM76_9BILA|nr:unnamed protein product [Rotaria sordida]
MIWDKISDRVFISTEQLVERVRRDIIDTTVRNTSRDLLISIEGSSVMDTHRCVPEFKWMRLLSDTLKRFTPTERSRQDMINTLSYHFDMNAANEKFVNDLAEHYQPKDALTWYCKAGPLFLMLNRALRNGRMDVIYKYRQIIRDISLALQHEHCAQHQYYEVITMGDPYYVFRGQNMPMANIVALQGSINKVVSFNGFISTSHDSNVAKTFLQSRESGFEPVLFAFKIDRNQETTAFADIKDFSSMKSEDEVLFDLNCLFRVTAITKKESEEASEVETTNEPQQPSTVPTTPAHCSLSIDFDPLPFTAGYVVDITDTCLISTGILRIPLASQTEFTVEDATVAVYFIFIHGIVVINSTDFIMQPINIYLS